MNLNKGQEEAAQAILTFLLDPHKKDFILSGGPGYGKSYLVEYIISVVFKQYQTIMKAIDDKSAYHQMLVTGTSNSAVDSLGVGLAKHGMEPTTIHKALNLRVQQNGKQTVLMQSKRNQDLNGTIIIIDEYTLIDNELDKWLQDGTSNSKVIFVGDKDQLLAVRGLATRLAKREADYTLTEPVRTNSQEILDVTNQLKKMVRGEIIDDINLSGNDVSTITEERLIEMIKNNEIDFSNSRVITSTNARVIDYNNYVRSVNNLPDNFVPNERVTNNRYARITCPQFKDRVPVGTDMDLIVESYLGETTLDFGTEGTHTFKEYSVRIPGRGIAFNTHNIDSRTQKYLIDQSIKIDPLDESYDHNLITSVLSSALDLRSSFSSTIYKAQGRGFHTVFIDLSGFLPSTHYQTLARSLYVGNSRATHKVYYVGELHDTLLRKLS